MARRLIGHYGGLRGALSADPNLVAEPDLAEGCRILHSAKKLFEVAAREHIHGSQVIVEDRSVIEYLQLTIGSAREECFLAVYLDGQGHYLQDEIVARGNCRQLQIGARTFLHRALDLGAYGLLLAHNHPSGRCEPSADDISATQQIRGAASALDIRILDHLVVTSTQAYSIQRAKRL
jgi:DNA repair protein RadC